MDESQGTPPLIAAPRHLRKRVLHTEIPDALLVPGVDPLPVEVIERPAAKRQAGTAPARIQAFGRKRAVALMAVIVVSISIVALVIALVVAG
ncbi:hypothetical protein [Pseudarthrobacter sp. PH31-O2]|uniref:hypothetical protein n=1 Tax=Pseudarthrobacter sp. PH31-O2 TaxID=3046206 RepID=UPI0024B89BF5|nr:hypothetical protein [Pseudarthrobacter sp. PH31-O2]MDJ0351366.1 hypothetical protein [Pseudarthrobacter sp. PH31-O2]